jgi:hypothetical protein
MGADVPKTFAIIVPSCLSGLCLPYRHKTAKLIQFAGNSNYSLCRTVYPFIRNLVEACPQPVQ